MQLDLRARRAHHRWICGLCAFGLSIVFVVACAPAKKTNLPLPTSAVAPTAASTATLTALPAMLTPRAAHSATLLADGRVLVVGGFRPEGTREVAINSAELYDPATNRFEATTTLNAARSGHTATLLLDGRVLVTGGWGERGRLASAELFDPRTASWSYATALAAPRASHTATRLVDGRVALIGGDGARNVFQRVTEIYDPVQNIVTQHAALRAGRIAHSATPLADGTILVAGGGSSSDTVLSSAEVYDPQTDTFVATEPMHQVRYKHAAVLEMDGNVLLIGGSDARDWTGKYATTERYNPQTRSFAAGPALGSARFKLPDGAVRLASGDILVASGSEQVERYAHTAKSFVPGVRLSDTYYYTVLTPLADGRVLLTGGYDPQIQPTNQAWMYG